MLTISGSPTGSQVSSYWGRNSVERVAKWTEVGSVMFFGCLLSASLSFVFGDFLATILGVFCFFYGILGAEVQAYQRNWEFLGGRDLVDPWVEEGRGLYGALFLGRVADITVVEEASATVEYDFNDFQDYTMETDELERFTGFPYLLRARLQDREGRMLQVHARMSEEYLDLKPNQPVSGILLSTSPNFRQLAALSDFVVPDAECWIGDYPYLNRASMERFLANDAELWEMFQDERGGRSDGGRDIVWRNEDDPFYGLEEEQPALVSSKHRRKRR